MTISIVAAIGENRKIGFEGKLPWKLLDDTAMFKKITLGHKIIMGRKTYESIGHPLPGRENIILTNHPDFSAPGCQIVLSLNEALEKVQKDEEVFVIGGGLIYNLALPLTQKMYLSHVDADVQADAFFPEFNSQDWIIIHTEHFLKNERNEFPFTYTIYERKSHV